MGRPLELLIIEDSDDDAQLVVRYLQREGIEPSFERVDSREELERAVVARPWRMVLCDYSVHGMRAPQSIETIRARVPELPIIVLSGSVGEEEAVACMRAGAQDFVLKHNLARLAPAIERELREAVRHAEEAKTRDALNESRAMLQRGEKLRALGEMAAGISHDMKNALAPLPLLVDLAERAVAENRADDVRGALDEVRGVVGRMVQTLDRLRDYSRQEPDGATARVELSKLAREAVEIARPRMATRGESHPEIRLDMEDVFVWAHAAEIVNAIVNIVVNAIDALDKGGHIEVRVRALDGGASVQVIDDGPGMPEEVSSRVFEPFFTTKGDAGTGLGLAMVYATVKRHGGRIAVTTAPGEGTTFTLWLPGVSQLTGT